MTAIPQENIEKRIAQLCQQSKIGKKLPAALYIHVSAIDNLDPALQAYEQQARTLLPSTYTFTLIKFSYDQPKISYLLYPDFDNDSHPALHTSIQVNLELGTTQQRDYSTSNNPPILHRKETFVTISYAKYPEFAELTRQEEAIFCEMRSAALLKDTSTIGTRNGWQQRLQDLNVKIEGHQVITQTEFQPKIDRHKAAIRRPDLSKPVRLALEAGLFNENTTFFDYGCGHGEDIKRISDRGFTCSGWDPFYRPHTEKTNAEIVNLGYVINVIEKPTERREALLKAWELCQKALIVSAQVLISDIGQGQIAYSDGIISSRNTFQKYFEQEELKTYIDQVLGVDSVPVALGIYFIFRDEAQAQSFRASRFRSRATTPRIRLSTKRFEDYQELLSPLMEFFTERGRLPVGKELARFAPLLTEFSTVRRAFNLIIQATNQNDWDAIADKRRQDILVFLALSNFDNPYKRLKLNQLTPQYQTDIKSLFGSYQAASTTSDLMLFNLGRSGFINLCCQNSKIGLLDDKFLTIHISALESLDTMLRLYEGCVSRTIGRMGATLIRFHLHKPKITYLFYPEFDTDPHPKLQTSMQIDLRDLHLQHKDYSKSDNPPILHRKDAYITPDYPLYEKFAKLNKQELSWGLLDDSKAISHLKGWQEVLKNHCTELQGHRLIWSKDADPEKVKRLKAKHK